MAEAPEPFIRIRGLKQSFGDHEVLKGIDLDIMRGETLVILGGSGSGKSVLIKHLPGLLRPTHGTVTVNGLEISQLRERELGAVRRQMGFMFQGGALFDSMSVAENVAFPLREGGVRKEKEIAQRVAEALEIVRLPGEEDKMPADLSGGMRKRVALARAVVGKPACIFYDEPHAGLDPITADSIDHLIKDLQRHHQITNVVITHEMRSVFHIADRIVFLDQGVIRWTGTPDELQATQDPQLRAFIAGDSGEPWND
ncbi:MAG: ABC transporter ATP-binding protein [Akkermansiaceae bacterium]|jgi:phospholipid/cholesterol/gamma-HCH transport system ATP-binding protein|nr:ABC transporter ATP-binding protein [Akkermansiaceae bacterium]